MAELNKITILIDATSSECVSYNEGLVLAKDGKPFKTNCTNFFNFEYLEKYDDVLIIKRGFYYISILELLKNNGEYTQKEIKKSHNVEKMFLAGVFGYKFNDSKYFKEAGGVMTPIGTTGIKWEF